MFFDFYGLRQQPFGVTPDPAYLYPSQTHSEALAALSAGISEGRGFFALVAEPGMGKTTLLYRLLEGLRESARTAYLFQTQCDKREFLQYVLAELGVDSRGLGLVSLHNKLNEVLFAELLEGKRFVLVVDEAQNLDDSVLETIRLLSNFETTHTKLLQIVLAGQPELAAKLSQPRLLQLRQRIAVFGHLHRFSYHETAAYIDHRLQVAGLTGDDPSTPKVFRAEALAEIAHSTRGIPRNINSLCYAAMSLGCERGIKPVTAGLVREAAAKLGMESFADVPSLAITTPPESRSEPRAESRVEIKPAAALKLAPKTSHEPARTAATATDAPQQASLTYQAFTYQAMAQGQRPRWIYPAVAIGILAVLAISIPTLLRIAGPGLTRAASLSKLNNSQASRATVPPEAQGSGYSPEFGPAYSASPSANGDGQVLTVVAMPQQTLRDIAIQHAGRFDDEMLKEIRALNPQLNPDRIEPGQLIRIPLPAGTWQKSFDTDAGDASGAKLQPAAGTPAP